MQAWHSQPESHEAICSDAAALLAPRSQDRVESGHGVVQKGSVAFPAISGPAATMIVTLTDREELIRRRRQSCDVRKWSRDLARCVRVIHYIPIIDRGAADLERSTTIDRPSGHLTLESCSGDCVEKAADT